MLTILSTYLLDDANNARITAAAEGAGGRFIPAPREPEARTVQLDELIGTADVLLGGRLTAEQAQRAERLRWIHAPWAGVNSLIGLDVLRERAIMVTNSSGVMSDSVADQVMAYLLLMARDLPRQIRAQPEGRWLPQTLEKTPRRILRGSMLGILGYGAIGSAIARRARAFGMRVVAMRRSAGAMPPELDRLYGPSELGALLAESDMVVIALPLNDATRGMIGADQLVMMRPTAYLVNIARGAIVRQEELIDALENGVIAGAALDVFEEEPLSADSRLWRMPNVLVTPHSAGGFSGFWDAVTDLFLENLERFLDGGQMLNLVDLNSGY